MEGATLAAVCDIVPERALAASEKFGVPGVTTLSKLWPLVDAVCVCVPSGLHAKIGIQAAEKGKHMLTEKPADIKVAAVQKLIEACETAGVKHACISQHRFANDIRQAREAAQSGELGDLIQGDAYIKWYRTQKYYDSGDWRGTWALDGGGCLMNQGVHYVDMIQWVMGGIRSVRAVTRTMAHDIEVEDTATALVEYLNGAVGVIVGSTSVYPGLAERIEVHGKHGTIIIEADRLKVSHVDEQAAGAGAYGRGIEKRPAVGVETVKDDSNAGDPTVVSNDQHWMQINDFVRSIHDDRTPEMTCRDALEPLKVILAIYESSRKGGRRIAV